MVRTFIVCKETYLQPAAGALGGGMTNLKPGQVVKEDEYPLSSLIPGELERLVAVGKLKEAKS